MPGGLIQLISYGAQDVYLTGNPQITFFKVVYRRHTQFAMETIEKTFTGTVGFGNTISCKLTRDGDLINNCYIRFILNGVNPNGANFAWTRRLGFAIVNQVNITIGGTVIDRQYGDFLNCWWELSRQGYHSIGMANMIGDVPTMTNYDSSPKPKYTLYIPLQFWFNRFVGLSIPLISLQYHDTYLNFQIQNLQNLIISSPNFNSDIITINDVTLLVNYIYLDTEERRRFAIVGHEYLVEQLQFNGIERANSNQMNYILDFNHPVKELIFAIKNGNFTSNKSFIYYSGTDWSVSDGCSIIVTSSIEFNDPTAATGGIWNPVASGQIITIGTFNMRNNNLNTVYINANSLYTTLDNGTIYGITDKIFCDITIETDGTISIENIVTSLTMRDFSIPLQYMVDTRFTKNDPQVNIFNNYGLWIDGSNNPVQYGVLQFNGHDRFDRREGTYFNNVQPWQHHSNTPIDGINVYSFALYPEQHQPSGTSNFSRIDSSVLILTYADSTALPTLPSLQYFSNTLNQVYIFATNYNIFRIFSGLSSLAYSQ
jgi:hypothetical protein